MDFDTPETPDTARPGTPARLQRRVVFLEAAVTQMLRDRGQLREWFSAAELARMRLPGIPRSRSGVAYMANARGWATRPGKLPGADRQLYHYASLPRPAFKAMIDLVLGVPSAGDEPAETATVVPAWVLPVLRMLRTEGLALDAALRRVPAPIACPTLDEARATLDAMGLNRGASDGSPVS